MTTPFERFATGLRTTYRLLSPLGSGGAAHVYLAEDVKSGQRVAIKVLREEQATTISADRFLAEIDIVAQLEHPNIVPIYASGAVNGLPYFVMPFLEGQSLRARLSEAGRLPLDEVLAICDDVSAAIDYAHRRLVVHRDIKPENVLLQDGQAFVLDFGIALALDTIAHPRRTVPGSVPGTPAYMSPEQARGETKIDGWSDVYSFACVVYEMISGSPPFTGPWPVVLHRHVSAEPIPLGCRMPSIPHGLSAAVSRALAKEPSERFLTTGELVRAMRADTHCPERRQPKAIGGSLGPSCGFFFESRRFA